MSHELFQVSSAFTYAGTDYFLDNDIRVKPGLDALGALGDAGWYCIRSILWAVDYELPKTVTATPGSVSRNAAGVLLSCGASLQWDDGRVATFHCSFDANLTMSLTVTGTTGTLVLRDFILPYQDDSATFSLSLDTALSVQEREWRPLPAMEHRVPTDLPQEACMVREFARLVKRITDSGSQPDQTWPAITKKTHLVIDAVAASINRGFETVPLRFEIQLGPSAF